MRSFNDNRFQNLLQTERFGRRLIHLDTVSSTNDHASRLLDSSVSGTGAIDGTLVLSDCQTGGRGRYNREWLSPRGGLWFSLIMETALPGYRIPAVTLLAAYSAAGVLRDFYHLEASIKWPNDLYFKDRKFGGILSEQKRTGYRDHIIMGMGINIDIEDNALKSLGSRAADLAEITGKVIGGESLLARILARFEGLYDHFCQTEDPGPVFRKMENMIKF